MIITLKHERSGVRKQAKVGFSWTTFFFGCFVPLFRGDFKWALGMFLLSAVTLGLSWFYFIFAYNKIYIKGLLEKGYIPANRDSERILYNHNILVAEDIDEE